MTSKVRFVLTIGLLAILYFAYKGSHESKVQDVDSAIEANTFVDPVKDEVELEEPKEKTEELQEEQEDPQEQQEDAQQTEQNSIEEQTGQEDQKEIEPEPVAEEEPITKEEAPKIETEDQRKIIYLTFDDGPNAVTEKILDILKEYDAKGTFFMLEPAMRNHPETLKRIVKENHGVGLHGVTHDVKAFYRTEHAALDEMQTCQQTLKELTGVESYLVRTPYGSMPYFKQTFRALFDQYNFKLWDWNVDSRDWASTGDEYVKRVISLLEELDSSCTPVVLMHDREGTVAHLPALMQYLKENHYQTKIIENSTEPYHFKLSQ
ncbi:polysaccharide deacetylase family protein [Marinilactibacillus kalidii]|uniref:polysaccharide deacetylase family protein n=1 Tax=Marinilactibacillus kalidii TaxID=2820274 RepID=UPI001ABDE03E|nr:polysaccharide deacetylase family protein [Marinilactibacillus kalidii]